MRTYAPHHEGAGPALHVWRAPLRRAAGLERRLRTAPLAGAGAGVGTETPLGTLYGSGTETPLGTRLAGAGRGRGCLLTRQSGNISQAAH